MPFGIQLHSLRQGQQTNDQPNLPYRVPTMDSETKNSTETEHLQANQDDLFPTELPRSYAKDEHLLL